MDEPFSALDAHQFEAELKKVLDLPCAVIITLHRQNEALNNFDQVWEIRSGELIIEKVSKFIFNHNIGCTLI